MPGKIIAHIASAPHKNKYAKLSISPTGVNVVSKYAPTAEIIKATT